MHTFPKGSLKRVGTFEPCACCDRTHTGYAVGTHIELGWCDDHEDDVMEMVDFLDSKWPTRPATVSAGA